MITDEHSYFYGHFFSEYLQVFCLFILINNIIPTDWNFPGIYTNPQHIFWVKNYPDISE